MYGTIAGALIISTHDRRKHFKVKLYTLTHQSILIVIDQFYLQTYKIQNNSLIMIYFRAQELLDPSIRLFSLL